MPYRGYVTLKLNFTYKATQIDKRYYFSWLRKVNRTVIVNFTLKIVIVPQQELRVLGGKKRLPELATFWRSKKRKIPVSSYVTVGTESTLISSSIPICCYFSSNKSTCFIMCLRGDLLGQALRFLEVSSPLTLITYSSYSVIKYSIIILSILKSYYYYFF